MTPATAAATTFVFQPHSDLHLEMLGSLQSLPDIPALSPNLVLAGDIGVVSRGPGYFEYVRAQAEKFERVFVVPGNHEFYRGLIMDTILKCEEEFEKMPNVFFMNRSAVEIGGLRVVGCTLWSDIPLPLTAYIELAIMDYRMTGTVAWSSTMAQLPPATQTRLRRMPEVRRSLSKKMTTANDTMEWHREDIQFINEEIASAKAAGKKVLILTHHAPTHRESAPPEYRGNPLNHAFATSLEHMMAEPVLAWVYGHTHFAHDQFIQGVRVLANPWGYPGREETGFDLNKVVEIKC